jgi:hypothetical protein
MLQHIDLDQLANVLGGANDFLPNGDINAPLQGGPAMPDFSPGGGFNPVPPNLGTDPRFPPLPGIQHDPLPTTTPIASTACPNWAWSLAH